MNTTNGILYVSCGVPGSGKSTFLNEMKNPEEIIVSRDTIRFSILKPEEEYFSHEKEVYSKFLSEITRFIRNGFNVYADATHLNEKSRYQLLHGLHNRGCKPSEINAIYFNVPIDICLERNELRNGTKTYVPRGQIRRMFEQYNFPFRTEGFNHIWEVNEEGDVNLVWEEET